MRKYLSLFFFFTFFNWQTKEFFFFHIHVHFIYVFLFFTFENWFGLTEQECKFGIHISKVAVDFAHQNKGLGSLLMIHVLKLCVSLNIRVITLEV